MWDRKNKRKYSLFRRNTKRLFKNNLAVFGMVVIVIIVIASIFAPLISDYDPELMDLSSHNQPPSAKHLFGTDALGRDVFTRTLYGGRVSILVSLVSALGAATIGIILGSLSGFFGGIADRILVRVAEAFGVIPHIMIILILVAFLGPGLLNLFIVFSLTGWIGTFRLVRARFFSIREENFVKALQAFRISRASIMFKHMLPNTMGPVIVNITLSVSGYILSEAALSFLGMGVPQNIPTWGNIINAATTLTVMVDKWWLWVFTGAVIFLFVLAVNFFGDGLRDALDPKMSKKG